MVSFANQKSLFWLDPRTKILLLLCVNVVLISGGFSGASLYVRPLLALIPLFLLMMERKAKASILYLVFIFSALACESFLIESTTGILNLIILIFSSLLSRMVPGFVMGYYLVTTTKISELIAALEKMHIPKSIIIPFTVMLRFLPTVVQENAAISDAMRMRGIRMGGSNAIAMLEYRIVPVLMSTLKIGEELSAAALTRGLGSPEKRNNLCKVGFSWIDYLLILITITAFVIWLLF